jgi:hypothetical protein
MPNVTTTISYKDEEFGANEVSSFSRDVEDLDLMDWLWYLLKITELAGFDVKDIHAVTGNGKFFSTEE